MLIVIPPEKLPEVMRNIARTFNDIRRSTAGVWDDIKRDAALKPEDLFKHQQTAADQNSFVDQTLASTENKEENKDGSKPEST